MKFYLPFRRMVHGHSRLGIILMVGLWSLTLSISQSFALALQPGNSAPIAETTITSNPRHSELVLEDRIDNPSITLGATSGFIGTIQDPTVRSTQTRTVDFSYRITNDSISPDRNTVAGGESFMGFSTDTFPPMWIGESTGEALFRLMQLYGPGLGIQ